ncbi:MAG: sigma-70 family RNA polymerase sigma factor [Thermoleophilia bacterium]|nr:sigma-70 family RNA polymerase sigma factor [Thermoleophilia bacterium]
MSTVPDPAACVDAVPFDLLTNEDLISAYHRALDVTYLDELLRRNEGLLHHALKRFSYSSEAYEDLFQVARLGLIKAAQRYDRQRGTSFATYAVAIVDGEIRHYLRDNLLIRQPRWARALYRRIQEAQTEFYRAQGRSPTMSELSEAVNLQEEGVLEVIRVYGALNLHSLDEPFGESNVDPPDRSLMRSAKRETFALPIEDRIVLYDALAALSDLHKRIIYLMFFRDLTQQEVADEIGMTQRTVSREQSKALARLRVVLGKKIF